MIISLLINHLHVKNIPVCFSGKRSWGSQGLEHWQFRLYTMKSIRRKHCDLAQCLKCQEPSPPCSPPWFSNCVHSQAGLCKAPGPSRLSCCIPSAPFRGHPFLPLAHLPSWVYLAMKGTIWKGKGRAQILKSNNVLGAIPETSFIQCSRPVWEYKHLHFTDGETDSQGGLQTLAFAHKAGGKKPRFPSMFWLHLPSSLLFYVIHVMNPGLPSSLEQSSWTERWADCWTLCP